MRISSFNPGFGHHFVELTAVLAIHNGLFVFNTEQHYRKALETDKMHYKMPAEITSTQPVIKHILVVRANFAGVHSQDTNL
jgi:hypothetical protein